MSLIIHSRNTENGIRYRLWSTCEDHYVTKELGNQELHDTLQKEALRSFEESFAKDLARANKEGSSSSVHDDPRDMDKGWEQE